VAEAAAGCDAIVNFAAETHVDRSILGPAEFIQTNVAGAQVLLDHVRDAGIRLVHVSTDEVYGDVPEGVSSVEDDPLRPSSPYSAAKAGGDLQVLGSVRTYGVDALITRGSNTYGPNQYPEKLLPLFVTNALDGEPLPMYGDGEQTRDWLFVEDHAAAIELALRRGRAGEVYNVGGGEEATNRRITDLVLAHTGADESLVRRVEDRPGHDRRYSLDTTKAREELGWEPQTRLAQGFPLTAAWYAEHRSWWEPIKSSGGYREYYEKQYAARLEAS
jgi:dTDP-glucose 4,6-dehydratase